MAKSLFSKQRRIIWSRRIKGFWEEYSHNRIGLFGLVIVIFYSFIAISAPYLTPHDPITGWGLSGKFAMPEWMAIFPQYSDWARNMEPPIAWTVTQASSSIDVTESGSDVLAVRYTGDATETVQTANFTSTFMYPYQPPPKFDVTFTMQAVTVENAEYSLELFMFNPAGVKYPIWTSYFSEHAPFSNAETRPISVRVYPSTIRTELKEKWLFPAVFTEKGQYIIMLTMSFKSTSPGTCEMRIEDTYIKTFGRLFGIFGTDSLGRDIFTQIVYGAQISLAVGLLAAICSTSIGISIGVIAGYIGGVVDEGLMRIADILLCLPVLPLLLGLVMLFGTSVWYLVLLIAVFGWMGLSRLIRSHVLSLKEMPFTECARAAGGSKFYIMIKHMLPNVLPIALAAMVLSVPAAILTEAAISFIGLGDPGTPTWGRMLNSAAGEGGFWHLAWWWFLPPGLAITLLTLSFVFIGHAVDEVVNPKLRRRR